MGARTAVITGATKGPALEAADEVLRLPGETWSTLGPGQSVLALGGQYELALWLLGDLAVDVLMRRHNVSPEALAAGHVNLG